MKKEFLSIKILHGALALGAFLFFMVTCLLNEFEFSQNFEQLEILDYIPLIVMLVCIPMSKLLDQKILSSFKNDGSEIMNYRTRIVIRSALLEGATLLAIVTLLLNGHLLAAIVFVIGWVSLVLARPTENQFSEDYNLTGQERRELMQD